MQAPSKTQIREAAQRLATAHNAALALATALEHAITMAVKSINAAHRPGIDAAAEEEAAAMADLQKLLDSAPGLFEKPRSATVDGVRYGYRKEQDGLDWDEDALVITRIKALPDLADLRDVLIRTEETLNVAALAELDKTMQRKIGVRQVAGADHSFITFTDSDADKIVKAILADAAKRQGEADDKKGKKAKAKLKEAV